VEDITPDKASQTPTEPLTGSDISCEPMWDDPVIAHAKWIESDRELWVVGPQTARGESDFFFEVINAKLLLSTARESCLLAAVSLGDLTREMPAADVPTTEVLDLSIQPIGAMDGFYESVAFESESLPDGSTLLVVYLMRDVQFGLTERYAVPVIIKENTMVAGDRVQVGRDAMGLPAYYGVFTVDNSHPESGPRLVLKREGMGNFSKHAVFELDAGGAMRVTEKSAEPAGPPVAEDQRDGSDLAHALRVCGPQGAQQALMSKDCPDGSSRQAERTGIAGGADDDHMVDHYRTRCESSEQEPESIYVDIYHCDDDNPRQ
jgi:hypothetical protein